MISSPTPALSITADAPAGPRVMLVHAGGRCVALNASSVREVAQQLRAIRLPGAPPFVSGVVNVRGTLVPLVDLGRLIADTSVQPNGWLVMLELSGRRCALAVDSLPVLIAADAPASACSDGSTFLDHEVCVGGARVPLLNGEALAVDFLLQ